MGHLMSRVVGLTVASLLATATATPAFADVCHKVDFGVQNNFKVKIKAISMEYAFSEDGKVRTEAFPDAEVESGKFKTVAKDQDLTGGEGYHLKSLRLHFKAWCGGKWTAELIGIDDTSFDDASTCKSNSNRSYRYDTNTKDICNTL